MGSTLRKTHLINEDSELAEAARRVVLRHPSIIWVMNFGAEMER